MNKHIIGLLVATALLAGCSGLKQTIVTPVVSDQIITNMVITALPGGGYYTNYNVTSATVTNYVVNPVTQGAVQGIGALVPGYGAIATAFLGLLATGYASWLNRKNKSIAVTTIQGIEQFRNDLKNSGEKGQMLDNKLVEYLRWAQAAGAVAEAASKLVDESTKDVPTVVVGRDTVNNIVNAPVVATKPPA